MDLSPGMELVKREMVDATLTIEPDGNELDERAMEASQALRGLDSELDLLLCPDCAPNPADALNNRIDAIDRITDALGSVVEQLFGSRDYVMLDGDPRVEEVESRYGLDPGELRGYQEMRDILGQQGGQLRELRDNGSMSDEELTQTVDDVTTQLTDTRTALSSLSTRLEPGVTQLVSGTIEEHIEQTVEIEQPGEWPRFEVKPDGTQRTSHEDGTVFEEEPGGITRLYEPSGRITQTEPSGMVRYTEPDGTRWGRQGDGTEFRLGSDGSISTRLDDTTWVERRLNGTTVYRDESGSVYRQVDAAGREIPIARGEFVPEEPLRTDWTPAEAAADAGADPTIADQIRGEVEQRVEIEDRDPNYGGAETADVAVEVERNTEQVAGVREEIRDEPPAAPGGEPGAADETNRPVANAGAQGPDLKSIVMDEPPAGEPSVVVERPETPEEEPSVVVEREDGGSVLS